jgi:signal transduction histidine kinase
MRNLLFFLLFIVSPNVNGQLDSLLKIYPKQKGAEQVLTLSEISYQYTASDPEKAVRYGKLAFDKVNLLKNPKLKAQVLNDWSIAYLIVGNYDSVLVLAKNAHTIYSQLKDSIGIAKALNKMANANFELGNYAASLEQNLASLKIFEAKKMENACGQMYVNVGVVYEKFNQFDEALRWYDKVAVLSEKLNDTRLMLDAYGNRGVVFMKQRKHQQADKNFMNAARIAEQNQEWRKLAFVYQNQGVNARMQRKHQEGIVHYNKALNEYTKLKDKTGMSLIYVNLGQCYIDMNDTKKAEEMLFKGLNLAEESGSMTQLRHAYNGLSRLETLKGNFEKADQYLETYASYMDSIYSDKTIQQVSEMQVKYQSEQREKELLKKQIENDRFRYWLTISIVSVIALALLVFVLLFNYRWKVQSEKLEGLRKIEKERGRIARDLHDHLGAELTLVASKIDIAAFGTLQESEKLRLEELASMVRNAGTVLRETVWSIQNESVNPTDLIEKLKKFAERFMDGQEVQIITAVHSTQALKPAQALNLFRIGQEALTNAFKYAGATELHCVFENNVLKISDNGNGFDKNSVQNGFGLRNMEKRATEINARFTIDSTNNGTIVLVKI